jgi:hypothetical protein
MKNKNIQSNVHKHPIMKQKKIQEGRQKKRDTKYDIAYSADKASLNSLRINPLG